MDSVTPTPTPTPAPGVNENAYIVCFCLSAVFFLVGFASIGFGDIFTTCCAFILCAIVLLIGLLIFYGIIPSMTSTDNKVGT